jgi:aspartyl-tRNA(Asn)/glutamyl-tRNA(Gln) amidotransferase subunit C
VSFDEKDVAKIARLARLSLTPEELHLYAQQFEKILGHVDELKKAQTEGVPATSNPMGAKNVMREDVPEPAEGEAFLALAPAREASFFKVRKVIE